MSHCRCTSLLTVTFQQITRIMLSKSKVDHLSLFTILWAWNYRQIGHHIVYLYRKEWRGKTLIHSLTTTESLSCVTKEIKNCGFTRHTSFSRKITYLTVLLKNILKVSINSLNITFICNINYKDQIIGFGHFKFFFCFSCHSFIRLWVYLGG